MKIATITLMRKGSKRFPNKCMAEFMGMPLFMHTIDFALKLGYPYYLFHDYDNLILPDEVNQIKRLPEFAGDNHQTCKEILWSKIDADIYIFLQVTNPIRSIRFARNWIRQFIDSKVESGIACKILRNKYVYRHDMQPLNFGKYSRTDNGCHRYDILIETGNFYIFKKIMLKEQHITHTENIIYFDDPHLIDIDTPEDLKAAEIYYKGLNR